MRSQMILTALVLLGWATAAAAQSSALELIPHDAGAALAVSNLKDLREKGDKLAKELNLRNDVKFSDLFNQLFTLLDMQGAVDEDNSAAIMAVSAKSIGIPPLDNIMGIQALQLLVGVIPFKDRDKIGETLGFEKGELKDEKLQGVTKGKLNNFSVYVRGKHVYLGFNHKAVQYAATAKKRFGENLSAAQRKQFGQSDVVLQLGTVVWGKFWEEGILKEARRILGEKMDAKEKEMGEKIVKSMEGVRFGLAGLRLEKAGLHFNLLSAWEGDNQHVKEILGLLRYGETPTDLKGLPAGNVLFAEAAKGNGVANSMLARVLFKAALQQALGAGAITSDAERPMVVGVFNEIWYHLLGNKTALYHNDDLKKHGALTLISILDTVDGQKFFDHMAHLATIADGGLKPGKTGEKGTLNVDQLVKDLVDQDHRTQQLANLKLRLLGAPALFSLSKAMYFKDAQLAEESRRLYAEIDNLAKQRKKEIPAGNWFLALRPTLQVFGKTAERDGFTLKEMQLKLPKQAQHLAKNLQELFGPNWDVIRFAFQGKNVVIRWGSNNALFDETLANLKDGKPGLAEAKHLQSFYQQSNNSRRVEMHFATAPLMALFDAGPGGLPAAGGHGLSSIGLLVEPDSLQVDVWLPLGEARLLAKLLNF